MSEETEPKSGHDGPYPAPVVVGGLSVDPGWIDYNGHMNVGYYGVAFDQALEVMLDEHLGLGETYVRTAGHGPYILQSHLHFTRELLEGAGYTIHYWLVDADAKRLHYYAEMFAEEDGALCATQEALIVNVSQSTGRSAPFPGWAHARLARMAAEHENPDLAARLGAPLGIRRNS